MSQQHKCYSGNGMLCKKWTYWSYSQIKSILFSMSTGNQHSCATKYFFSYSTITNLHIIHIAICSMHKILGNRMISERALTV